MDTTDEDGLVTKRLAYSHLASRLAADQIIPHALHPLGEPRLG